MIGEPDFWDGPWGKEAIWLLVEYLFDQLGVHRISITVSELQGRLLRDLRSLGFQDDGTLRDNEIAEGRYIDHLVLSILEDEYRYRS
jgi:RimJ/RimL family protein N-acetyltransferase